MSLGEEKLPFFHTFLTTWFNEEMDFSDLEFIADEMAHSVRQQTKKDFLREVELMLEARDWETVGEFVKEHGRRRLSPERLEQMLLTIKKHLEIGIRNHENIFGLD
ncbi:hypothetical protein [Calidithermus chliarophilus]|uniref:hypothetical protein n=1 Tax=Calidithermus chliarophilus TaxID=52023 RepID=UPI000482BBE8|nr:hypothetical protein [Calidithermus chliarophilus]